METIQTLETTVSTNKGSGVTCAPPPKVGMLFKSWKEIEFFYQTYAKHCGFGVTRVQGSYTREAELAHGKRKSKKCECNDRVYGSLNVDWLWILKTVVLEHTHTLSLSMANLVKEYRMKKLTSTVRKRLINVFEEGLSVSQIRGCLGTENGNLPSVKDLQHEVYKQRRLKMASRDARAMMEYFDYMQADNQNFYHENRLDDDGRLKNVMWVDARSRVAYEDFGDVVCFDATYLTNELIFEQWVSCMGNKAPISILTDQAASMRNPLAEVMPNTCHRWCIWHIMRKFPEKLGKCALYDDFKNPLKNIIYYSFTVEEFQTRWCEAMKLYGLEDNEWLQDLFIEKHMWVTAYMKEYFWVSMKTTQRVESINYFFDGYVTCKTKLFEFPEKYNKAMKKRVMDEKDADARDSKYIRQLVSGFKVERYFQKIYTDAKFQELQKECVRMLYVQIKEEKIISEVEIHYLVLDRVWVVREGSNEETITYSRRFYSLIHNPITKHISYDCRKFEKDGILCKHVIRVWDENFMTEFPLKFVLNRWKKDVLRKHTRIKVAYHDPTQTEKFEAVRQAVIKIRAEVNERRAKLMAKNGSGSEIGSSNSPGLEGTPKSVSKTYNVATWGNKAVPNTSEINGGKGSGNVIQNPVTQKKPKGRPKGSRNKTLSELGYNAAKGKNSKRTQKQAHVGFVDESIQPTKLPVKRRKQPNPYTEFYAVTPADDVPCDDFELNMSTQEWTSDHQMF
ncbi:protein FAR1-RELATED SEQUENCE 6-like [Chenopodium quinoa]|uniref:protein FAR1-RELATED SEQUENCE 6-like n=1 Tax=Chenopodium quinoa TaxID=63459 RepID=UPI000B76F9FC|nr:protein FAR1-RELATED SEQUENCE 6-like [Chenopodium quinoa]